MSKKVKIHIQGTDIMQRTEPQAGGFSQLHHHNLFVI